MTTLITAAKETTYNPTSHKATTIRTLTRRALRAPQAQCELGRQKYKDLYGNPEKKLKKIII